MNNTMCDVRRSTFDVGNRTFSTSGGFVPGASVAVSCLSVSRSFLPLCLFASFIIFSLSGCGGSGIDGRTGDDGGVGQAVAVVEAEWLVIELATGSLEARMEAVADLTTNPIYRTSHLVLRRINAVSTALGSASGERWAQDDEPRSTAAISPYFISVFELSRGQWRHLSASTPWREVVPASLAGLADDDQLPICGVSLDQVVAACAAWNRGGTFALPSAVQWEAACRSGSTTAFSWGDQSEEATVSRFALVRQTVSGIEGPWPVGQREANAFGLYDMHGNIGEWTTDSGLRGGSWHDGLPLARSANRMMLDRSTSHALAGARLIYAP